jgi:hypothetical protein
MSLVVLSVPLHNNMMLLRCHVYCFCCLSGYYIAAALVITLLLLYSLSSYTDSHSHTRVRLLLTPASQFTSSSSSSSSGQGDNIAKQLLSELTKGPTGSLLEQYILRLTNFSSLSAAQLPLLLQGTNFTTLSTAAVLDAAGSRLSSQHKWQLANLHQSLICLRVGLSAGCRCMLPIASLRHLVSFHRGHSLTSPCIHALSPHGPHSISGTGFASICLPSKRVSKAGCLFHESAKQDMHALHRPACSNLPADP